MINKYLLIVLILVAIAGAIYGVNTIDYQTKEDKQTELVDANFMQTTQEIRNQTVNIDKLLTERTPKFDAIIENQKTIIQNEYILAKAHNVTGVSNQTFGISNDTHDLGKISGFGDVQIIPTQ